MVTRSLDKLHELILYIAWQNQDDPDFASTRLTKDLYYTDFEQFRQTGDAITGSDYLAMPNGPMLEGLQGILEGMQLRKMLRIEGRASGPFMQKRPVPLREPNRALFTPGELRVIDRIIGEHRGQTATAVSRQSHRLPGWQLTRQGERIPYGVAWLVDPEPTEEERRRARALAARLGRV